MYHICIPSIYRAEDPTVFLVEFIVKYSRAFNAFGYLWDIFPPQDEFTCKVLHMITAAIT